MIKIIIMHRTIVRYDAISNDIEGMYNILKLNNYCKCFAENKLNSSLEYLDDAEALNIMSDEESIVIYHHSVEWISGEELIKKCNGKLIIRYHNITPSEYFKSYNSDYFNQCYAGRKQTERLIWSFPDAIWMVDSAYNALDINDVPDELIYVCPPFHKIEELSAEVPDETVMNQLICSNEVNILFVGRVAPNKGHLDLIEIINGFCNTINRNIKLWIIGKFDKGLSNYNKIITDRISQYGLEKNVNFIGEINDSLLLTYYLGADIFLCTSEHEGFCVPIIEAQNFKLPIIAKGSSAIPETIGKNQIVLGNVIDEYIAAIYLLANKKDYREYLREEGSNNFNEHFSYEIIRDKFISIMNREVGVFE